MMKIVRHNISTLNNIQISNIHQSKRVVSPKCQFFSRVKVTGLVCFLKFKHGNAEKE